MKNGQEKSWIDIDVLYYTRMFLQIQLTKMIIYDINYNINYNITTKNIPSVIVLIHFHLFIYIITFLLLKNEL